MHIKPLNREALITLNGFPINTQTKLYDDTTICFGGFAFFKFYVNQVGKSLHKQKRIFTFFQTNLRF